MRAIVLAAGMGKRLFSEKANLPKVLRELKGRPLIAYLMDNLNFIENKKDVTVVVGYKKEDVISFLGEEYSYASQDKQLGTGHAVNCAKALFSDYDGRVIVCYGDMPFMSEEIFRGMIDTAEKTDADAVVLTGTTKYPLAYGRIVRDENNRFLRVVEEKDCTEEQKKIKELNVGCYVFKAKSLFDCLASVGNNNAQGEYYLTDVPEIMLGKGMKVETYLTVNSNSVLGVNTLEDLARAEEALENA